MIEEDETDDLRQLTVSDTHVVQHTFLWHGRWGGFRRENVHDVGIDFALSGKKLDTRGDGGLWHDSCARCHRRVFGGEARIKECETLKCYQCARLPFCAQSQAAACITINTIRCNPKAEKRVPC